MARHKESPPAADRRGSGITGQAVDAGFDPTASNRQHVADFDFDRHIVDRVDESIWTAIYNGQFRLAVPCDICGRWLTAGSSKRAHRGPRCAAKVAGR